MGVLELFELLFRGVFSWFFLGAFLSYKLEIPQSFFPVFFRFVIVRFLFPLMTFTVVYDSLTAEEITELWMYSVAAVAFFLLAFTLSRLFQKTFNITEALPSYHIGNCFHNYGFLVYPIIGAIHGPEGLSRLFVFVMTTEVFVWTVGVSFFHSSGRGRWKHAISPPAIALLLALLAIFLIPDTLNGNPVWKLASGLGKIAVPVALMGLGGVFYYVMKDFRPRMIYHRQVLSSLLLRMIVIPLLVLPVCVLLFQKGIFRDVLCVEAVMPAALMPISIATMFRAEVRYLTAFIVSSTLLSALTIPLWLSLLGVG